MGVQQLLLIVLAVIIVGTAITIGIANLFKNSTTMNRLSLSNEMLQFVIDTKVWDQAPQSIGGSDPSNRSKESLIKWLAFTSQTEGFDMETENGVYTVTFPNNNRVKFLGWGTEKGKKGKIKPGNRKRGYVRVKVVYNFRTDKTTTQTIN